MFKMNTNKKMIAPTLSPMEENKENVTLIWFNPTSDTMNDIEDIKDDLRALNNFILCPSDIDSCVADVKSIKEEKIFLITGGNNAYQLLPDIINLPLLDSIFIYPEDRNKFGRLCGDFAKVVDIFDNVNDLIKSIKEKNKHVNRQMEVISFYEQRQQGTRDLTEQFPNFLWFQLFKDVIQHLPHDKNAKEEMLIACQQYYRDNGRILKDIDEFAKDYDADECIRWYTRDTFVYKLINKALRTEDIEQLYIFRYYIADLSRQLAKKCEIMRIEDGKTIFLYRGSLITTKELEALKANITKLFAANSYWSTTRSYSYALTFARKIVPHSDIVAVMYEIECDLQDQDDSVVFADISDSSDFPEEQEVLFDAGSLFRIEEITNKKEDGVDLHTIRIRTTTEGREVVEKYIAQNRNQMEEESPRIILSVLLRRMGRFKRSLQFLQYLRKNPDGENMAYILTRIGKILKYDEKYEDALEHFKQAFQLTFYSNPPDKRYSAYVLHSQGLIYCKMGDHKNALEYCRRAVTILGDEVGKANAGIAQFYSSMGRIYRSQGDLKKAFEYHYAALEIRERIMPNHIMNAFSYADIAQIFCNQQNYNESLKYHLKALELREKLLPSDSQNTAFSLHQVGKMYYALCHPQMARDHYLRSLEIYKAYTDINSCRATAQIREDVARTYDYNAHEALDNRLEAMRILQSTKSVNYANLARLLDDIACSYKVMGSTEDALSFYKQALKIREEKLPRYTFSLCYSFNNLAYLYEQMDDMPSARIYHHKTLEVYEYHHPYEHRLCEKTRRNIQRVEQKLQRK